MRTGAHVKQYETVRQHKNGSLVPVSLTMSPIKDAAGEIRAVSVIARDITERLLAERALRDAEERMRFALDAARVGVWEANFTTGATYCSETCERMHGLEPGTFAKTFDAFTKTIHPDDRQGALDAIEQATAAHTNTELEYRTVWPDGTVHRIGAVGHFFYDPSGVAVRGAGIAIDITERHLLEEQLRQSQKMDAVGQLAGGVAHDFNNLLTAILGYARFLLKRDPPEADARRADVEEIRQAGRSRGRADATAARVQPQAGAAAAASLDLNAVVADIDADAAAPASARTSSCATSIRRRGLRARPTRGRSSR